MNTSDSQIIPIECVRIAEGIPADASTTSQVATKKLSPVTRKRVFQNEEEILATFNA